MERISNKEKDIGMVIWAGILRMRKGWDDGREGWGGLRLRVEEMSN